MLDQSQHLIAVPGNGAPWQIPRELPDLRRVNIVSIDSETNDAGLRAGRGSSWAWGDGYVCGISVSWHEGGEIRGIYIPMRHPDTDNFDPAQVYRWLKDLIASGVRIVTMNGVYDFGWFRTEAGILMPPSDRLEEVGALAALVDENQHEYSLDAICRRCGLPGKDTALLEEAVKAAGFVKGRKKINVQSHIWQLPARYVGPYAEIDAVRTLEAYEVLTPIIEREGTRDAYRLEVDLLPMVLEMRHRGIRIDQDAAEQARDLIAGKRDAALKELSDHHGAPIGMHEISSSKWKIATFAKYNIVSPNKTPKGAPSFKAGKTGWMATHPHWLPRLIAVASKYHFAASKFLEGHILSHIVNGRIYAEIHPHLSDEGGTVSTRFSYSDPPLQQMPSRDPELGPMIRRVFLPEEGEVWCKPDVSQQEFRFLVHYAEQHRLPGAKQAGDAYRNDPDADFHQVVADMAGIPRTDAKNSNFAKIYSAGVKKFAEMIGKSLTETQAIIEKYDRKLPFVAKLSLIAQQMAMRNGYTELYDGARRHWNQWEVAWLFVKGAGPCDHNEAQRRIADPDHPWHRKRLSRFKTYTALNALIQGSAARHTKLWMRACRREGIVPMLQMHDALETSVTSREQGELIARLGCEAVSLTVPVRVDVKYGRNWGDATHTWEELTGESAPSKPTPTATVIPIRPGIVVPPAPTIIKPRGPAISIPIDYTSALVQPTTAPSPSPPPPDAAEEAAIDLADLIEQSVPKSRKICCPFHGETKPSMHIYVDHYYCYGCGEWGDQLDWLTKVEDLSFDSAVEIITNWDGPFVALATASCAEEDAKRTAYALRWWNGARPIAGTLAARYLAETRGIDLNVLPDDTAERALRFHPNCVFGAGTRHPCLIALMRDPISGVPTGIQRTALTADARKIDRMMLGPAGVVQIWPSGHQLVIGEGLETTLAAATRLDYRGEPLRPAWATLSDGAMERFPMIDGIERLIILADNDVNGAGQAAAESCKQRWRAAGRRGAVLTPPRQDSDFNDFVLERRDGACAFKAMERAP